MRWSLRRGKRMFLFPCRALRQNTTYVEFALVSGVYELLRSGQGSPARDGPTPMTGILARPEILPGPVVALPSYEQSLNEALREAMRSMEALSRMENASFELRQTVMLDALHRCGGVLEGATARIDELMQTLRDSGLAGSDEDDAVGVLASETWDPEGETCGENYNDVA